MNEVVGVLPAAGRGSRLGPIPCSKEIMPLGFEMKVDHDERIWRPITAIETHLRAFKEAGIRRVAIIVSEYKHDILRYLGDGSRFGLEISYLYQQQLRGMPFALDLASSWAGNAHILFSMPDTIIEPDNIMSCLLQCHKRGASDLTLGLFHTATPYKYGMVEIGAGSRPINFIDKPQATTLQLMWGLGVWSEGFTVFLRNFVNQYHAAFANECVLSDVFQAAMLHGVTLQSCLFDNASYRDIGTPEDFQSVVYDLAFQQAALRGVQLKQAP